jgi:fluoroquinolone resistance protein
MAKEYIEDQHFKNENYSETPLQKGEYEACTFTNCNFLNSNLSEIIFSDCTFEHCDLSNAKVVGTAFREVKFRHCKLMGLHFDDCNTFSIEFDFEHCVLDFASFFKLKLKNTAFKDCKLEQVDFVETDLTGAVFKNCDLRLAVFDNSNLEGADFRTAFNFSIDPEKNRLKKAKFSTHNIVGLLEKYKIVVS